MKIVCLQLEPQLGEVERNTKHATTMVSELKPKDVDVLVLPEMAFTGYVFTSKEHIEPYLEDAETGPSVQWAKIQAKRLNAHVVVGFPEKKKKTAVEDDLVYYNSIAFVDPQGRLVTTYAKTFLYYTDENWAEEGPGFKSITVDGLGKVGFGICMDVNPYQFKAPFAAFEFSSYHVEQKTNLLLCSMAWNKGEEGDKAPQNQKSVLKPPMKRLLEDAQGQEGDSGEEEEEWEDDKETEEEALERENQALMFETIHYWAMRMNPFYTGKEEAYVAIANRIGTESGILFVGSSCVMKLSKKGPELLGALSADKEGLLRVEIPI
ncbi:MAG: carbon-nitrogen hydrolase [Podila humilis]|nr:MAG: carbon-nitrogen hydrolase [Podila humilis]